MRRLYLWLVAGGLAAAMGVPGRLAAQGFSVNEHSTCAMGRAGTGTASPCADGSAMVFNPAGLASFAKGHGVITAGTTVIAARGSFTGDATGFKDDLKDNNYWIPAGYVAYGLTDKIAAGVGVFAPYGLTTEWPSSSQARFLGYRSHIQAIYVQPTIAAKLGEYIKVGAGLDINFFSVELRQHLDLAGVELPAGTPGVPPGATFGTLGIPPQTDFADAKLSGSATGFGYHAGIIIKATDKLSFGVKYLARQKVTIDDGKATFSQIQTGLLVAPGSPFTQLGLPVGASVDQFILAPQFQTGGPLVSQTAKTAVRLPEQWSVGLAYQVSPALEVLFDYNHQNWDVFQSLPFDFAVAPDFSLAENFQATDTFRFGADYGWRTYRFRLGFLSHNAASPDETVTPNLPEGGRSEITAGVGTRIGGHLNVDLAYQYIDQGDRSGRTTPAGTANNGLFQFHAHLFGATLSYAF
jgi:long-chain fatty acid transport protein